MTKVEIIPLKVGCFVGAAALATTFKAMKGTVGIDNL